MSLALDRRANYGPQPLDDLIRESLKSDNRLWVAGEVVEGPGAFHEKINTLYLSLKQPLFDITRLNTFLKSLLPGIDRYETHEFYQPSPDSDMSIGIIHYKEQIGTKKTRTTTIISPHHSSSLDGVDLQEGEFTEEGEEKLYRTTSLHVYPHPLAASVALQKVNLYQEATDSDSDSDSDIFVDTDLIGIKVTLTAPLIERLKLYDRGQRGGMLKLQKYSL